METKKCTRCNIEKTLDNYYYRKNRDCYDGRCSCCNNELKKIQRLDGDFYKKERLAQKKYHYKNKTKLNEMSRKYHSNHRKLQNKKMNEYYQKNKEAMKQYTRQYKKRWRQKVKNGEIILTPEQRIIHNLRSRLNKLVREREVKNLYSRLLGCDIKFLIKWFEHIFNLDQHFNMNWENKNIVWQIDHVTPCASFDLKDKKQQEICFHWTNLCPVLKPYNLSKKSKIILKDIMKQKMRVVEFIMSLENNEYKYSILKP